MIIILLCYDHVHARKHQGRQLLSFWVNHSSRLRYCFARFSLQEGHGNLSRSTTKPTKWDVRPANSDQPRHLPSLIRVFAVRMKKAWVLCYPLSTQRRLWSDWADAQADLNLRWVHMSFCWFWRAGQFIDNEVANLPLSCKILPYLFLIIKTQRMLRFTIPKKTFL